MTQAFRDLSGVKTIEDDILIWGKNDEEHNFRLKQVLERSRKVGLKLNRQRQNENQDLSSTIHWPHTDSKWIEIRF